MRWLWIPIALFGLGCAREVTLPFEGGQTGEDPGNGVECSDDPTALGLSDESPLGISAADVITAMDGESEASFTYASEDVTGLVIGVSDPHDVVYMDLTPVEGDAASCVDYLRIEVVLGFVTDDGAFDGIGEATLSATKTSHISLVADWEMAALAGSYAEGFEEGDSLRVSGTWDEATPHGTLRVVYDEGGGGGASSSSDEEIGSW